MKLTANAVKTLTSDKSDAIFFDDELKGFGYRVRVGAGGKVLRSWIVQYRHRLGHRRMTVGSAAALTAEQARGKAKELLAKVALGDDPQGDRRGRSDKDRLTLRFVIDEFLAAKTAKLPAAASICLRALKTARERAGFPNELPPDVPTTAVTQEKWRQEVYQLKGEDAGLNRKTFNRGQSDLLARELISQRFGWVWRTEPAQ